MLNNQENRELVLIEDLGMMYTSETSKQKRRYGIYRCYCGKEFKTTHKDIKSGNTKSCGCFRLKKLRESLKIHGHSKTNIYKTFHKMKSRCFNKNSNDYVFYGGRGITICDEWLSDFKAFYNWAMSNGYEEHLSIDRINNDGNYEPSNCRWVNQSTQMQNTRIIRSTNKSGYRGVSFDKNKNKFVANLSINYKRIYLGSYITSLEAAKAYNKYVIDNNLEHTLNKV